MRTLYLIRHGETAWNAEHRLQGRQDVALSTVGTQQASALKTGLHALLARVEGGLDDVTVVTSPLTRARQTAALLGLEPDLVDERWQEAELGEWTGLTREHLLAQGDGAYAAWRRGELDPPGAESLDTLDARVTHALQDLAGHDVVVVVTHGGPIRAVCRRLVGLEPGRLVPVQPGSLTILDLGGEHARLRAFNLTPFPSAVVSEPTD